MALMRHNWDVDREHWPSSIYTQLRALVALMRHNLEVDRSTLDIVDIHTDESACGKNET